MDESIRAYARLRRQRAIEELETAQENIKQGRYRVAISRAYYAVFYMASAALFGQSIQRSKHSTCFRYAPPGMDGEEDLAALNRSLLDLVQRQEEVFLISAEVRGVLALRANIVNFRTTENDLIFYWIR